MPSNAGRFARSVLSTYEARRDPLTVFASKSAGWSTPTGPDHLGTIGARPMGHPAFADLPLGASDHCEAAALFLDLDSHDAYATTDDDPTRLVPNPAKKKAHQHVLAARARYERALATADAAMLEAVSPPPGQSVLITKHAHDTITADLRDAEHDLDTAQAAHRAVPARLPLGQVNPGQQVLDVQTKLITHAIRIAAFNTATTLARAIRVHTGYARAGDEAHALVRQALTGSGDIDPAKAR